MLTATDNGLTGLSFCKNTSMKKIISTPSEGVIAPYGSATVLVKHHSTQFDNSLSFNRQQTVIYRQQTVKHQ